MNWMVPSRSLMGLEKRGRVKNSGHFRVVTEECSGEKSLKLGTKVQTGFQYDWVWGVAKASDLTN